MVGDENWKDNIKIVYRYGLKLPRKNKIIKSVDKALDGARAFIDKECLFGTLEDYLEDSYVTIFVSLKEFTLDIAPKSGEGHDFSFCINRLTGKVDEGSMMVGELISEPDDDEYFEE